MGFKYIIISNAPTTDLKWLNVYKNKLVQHHSRQRDITFRTWDCSRTVAGFHVVTFLSHLRCDNKKQQWINQQDRDEERASPDQCSPSREMRPQCHQVLVPECPITTPALWSVGEMACKHNHGPLLRLCDGVTASAWETDSKPRSLQSEHKRTVTGNPGVPWQTQLSWLMPRQHEWELWR